jgi:hypothetical protein
MREQNAPPTKTGSQKNEQATRQERYFVLPGCPFGYCASATSQISKFKFGLLDLRQINQDQLAGLPRLQYQRFLRHDARLVAGVECFTI